MSKESRVQNYIKQVLNVPVEVWPMNPQCRVSVVMPVYNEDIDTLLRPLLSLAFQKYAEPQSFEAVYIVNNSAADAKQNNQAFVRNQQALALVQFIQNLRTGEGLTLSARQKKAAFAVRQSGLAIYAIDKSSPSAAFEECNVAMARNWAAAWVMSRFLQTLAGTKGIIAVTDCDCAFSDNFIGMVMESFERYNLYALSGRLAVELDKALPHPLLLKKALEMGIRRPLKPTAGPKIYLQRKYRMQRPVIGCCPNLCVTAEAWALAGGMPPLASGGGPELKRRLLKLPGELARNTAYAVTVLARHSARAGLFGFGRNVAEISAALENYLQGKAEKIRIPNHAFIQGCFRRLMDLAERGRLSPPVCRKVLQACQIRPDSISEPAVLKLADALNQDCRGGSGRKTLARPQGLFLENFYSLFPQRDITGAF